MNRGRVRVFSSVFAGYSFLFKNFRRLLHVAWFPGLLFVAAGIIAEQMTGHINVAAMSNGEARAALIYILEVMSVYSLFQLAMTLVVVVGFYRVALYDFRPRGPLYFRFHTNELRTAGVWFLVVIALYMLFMTMVYGIIGVTAGYLDVTGAVDAVLPAFIPAGVLATIVYILETYTQNVFGVYAIICALVMYWAYSRFFLAIPAALDRKVSTLGGVWEATRKNGFRLFFYVFILNVSIVLFALSVGILIYLAVLVAATLQVLILTPEAVTALSERSEDIGSLIAGLPEWARYGLAGLVQLVVFLAYIFSWAIVIGSASAAFRGIWPQGGQET